MPDTKTNKPRVLLFDIETAPNLGWVWGKWEQDVIDFERQWHLLCFAYKWADEKKVHTVALPDFKGYKRNPEDDKQLAKALWNLLDEADVVIAHNGDAFDIPKANARFIANGFTAAPSPFKTIDTKKVASRYFRFDSNSLNDLGKYLRLGEKMQHGGFKIWQGCMQGDPKAWKTMRDYNAQDVVLLEQVYLTLRPYMTGHPDVSLLAGKQDGCPSCGGIKLHKRGFGIARTTLRQRYQCQECGYWTSRLLDKVTV